MIHCTASGAVTPLPDVPSTFCLLGLVLALTWRSARAQAENLAHAGIFNAQPGAGPAISLRISTTSVTCGGLCILQLLCLVELAVRVVLWLIVYAQRVLCCAGAPGSGFVRLASPWA